MHSLYVKDLYLFLQGFLLEKELKCSEKLLDILKSMNHPISMFILSNLNNGKDIPHINFEYIDVSDDDGMITIKKELNSDANMTMKIGKLLTAMMAKSGKEVPKQMVEEFINLYKAAQYSESSENKFELVSGKDITKWYHEKTYAKGGGTLNKSCMRYGYCQSFFTVYEKTPTIQLLILKNDKNELLGRALIWSNVMLKERKSKITFMDRVYFYKDSILPLFIEYADKNNIWHKVQQNPYTTGIQKGNEVVEEPTLSTSIVSLEWRNLEKYKRPHMDTLRYFKYPNPAKGKINHTLSTNFNDYDEDWCGEHGYPSGMDGEGWKDEDYNLDDVLNTSDYDSELDYYKESYNFKHLKRFNKF